MQSINTSRTIEKICAKCGGKQIYRKIYLMSKEIELMEVPLFASVSAGLGCEAVGDPIDFIMLPKTHGEIISIIVKGDSMEDTIYDGAIIIVRKDIFPEIGEIGVFLTKGTEYPDGLVKTNPQLIK